MKRFFQIAFRNIFRNTRRTALTMLVIGFGVAALILAGGFISANFEGLREKTIRNGVGHLQVYNARYLKEEEQRPLQEGIPDAAAVQTWIERQRDVVGTTAEVDFVGLISNGDKSEAVIARGVDRAREAAIGFRTDVVEGKPLEPGQDDSVSLLGTELAKSLNAHVGDVLTVMSTTSRGALNAVDVRVGGVFSTGIKEYDARALKMPLAAAQRLLGSHNVTKIIVMLDETRHTDAVASSLAAAGYGNPGTHLQAKTWLELATFYKQVVLLYKAIFFFLGLIIVILVVLSSSNTMMMSVLERIREIGTMMALGVRRRQILAIFVLEGALLGIFGGLLGLAASYGLLQLINHSGIMMPPPPTFSKGFPLIVKFVPELFAFTFVVMVGTLAVSALLPSWRAARLKIVDALGHI